MIEEMYFDDYATSIIDDPIFYDIAPHFIYETGGGNFGPFQFNTPFLSEEVIMGMYKSTLTDQMIMDSVKGASDFFNIKMPIYTFEGDTTGVFTLFKNFYFDDVLMYNREQLLNMGINDQDAIDLVMTHEAAHRAFQNNKIEGITGGSWEEELACDFFAGIRAELQGINVEKFSSALEGTMGGVSHPSGQLRAEFIKHGQDAAKGMMALGISPTYENCIDTLNKHLGDNQYDILASYSSLIDTGTMVA